MKENLKIALLAIIAVTLSINTYLQVPSKVEKSRAAQASTLSPDGHDHNPNPQLNPLDQTIQPEIPSGPSSSIQFSKAEHNFGKIKQDSKNKHVFKFTNTGDNPLIIENAVGSCGCTVPDYPKAPIAPGKTGEIIVEYSPGKQQGLQNKTVTVTANTNPKTTTLNIAADVEVID